jgi:hypothetical protein
MSHNWSEPSVASREANDFAYRSDAIACAIADRAPDRRCGRFLVVPNIVAQIQVSGLIRTARKLFNYVDLERLESN